MDIRWDRKKVITFLLFVLCHIFQQGSAQVTVSLLSPATCGQNVVLRCTFTGAFNSAATRTWKKGTGTIVNAGTSTDSAKYTEDTGNTGSNYFELTIVNFDTPDADTYHCDYSFDSGSLAVSCTTTPAPTTESNTSDGKCCSGGQIAGIVIGIIVFIIVVIIIILCCCGIIPPCWLKDRKKKGDHQPEVNPLDVRHGNNSSQLREQDHFNVEGKKKELQPIGEKD